jgi:hypothetical protein
LRRAIALIGLLAALLAGCGGSSHKPRLTATPARTTNLTACAGANCGAYAVTLNWSSLNYPGTTGYNLYVNGTQVDTATMPPFTFHGLDCGQTFTLGVQAHNNSGGTSPIYTTPYTTPACVGNAGPTVNYFVAQAAAGAANATSCANAAAVSTLSTAAHWTAGNVIGLCGTITSTIIPQASGMTGSPITVYWEPGATMSAANWSGSGNSAIDTNGKSNLTFDGGNNGTSIQVTGNGTANSSSTAYKGFQALSCDGCTFKNLVVANLYVHTQGSGIFSLDTTATNAIHVSGSNVIIANNTFHDCAWCVHAQLGSNNTNVEIYGNNIYNMDHGIAVDPTSGPNGPVFIFDNHLHDMANWDCGGGCHHDPIHCFDGDATGEVYNGFYIYDNRMDGDWSNATSSATFIEGNTGGSFCTPSAVWIFNNVATTTNSGPGTGPCCSVIGGSQGAGGFFNNTTRLPNNTVSPGGCMGVGGFNGNGATNAFQNNIMDGCNQLLGGYSSTSGGTNGTFATGSPDYDAFVNGGSNAFSGTGSSGVNCSTDFAHFSTWKTCMGGVEAHGVLYADDTAAGINANLSIAGGSPLAAAGVNLTATCNTFPTTPINVRSACQTTYTGPPANGAAGSTTTGAGRSTSTAWNIGAY